MPAKSKAVQAVTAIALHNPEKLYKRNRGVLSMSKKQLEEFASTPTKGLPKHKNAMKALVEGNASVAKKVAKGRK